MELAPIIVFAYNRPEHLRKTLTWLKQNEHADESVLFIYCDGAKEDASESDWDRVREARKVAREKQWCREVHVIESPSNKGLGTSIISGVTEVINQFGRVIVLEDDLKTSPFFLNYMNKCLDYYANRKSVFSISGLSRPHPQRFYPNDYPYDVYVSLSHHPQGWATWADRWKQVDWNADAYKVIKNDMIIQRAFNRMGADYFDALTYQQENNQNVWSIRFALSHFVNHAVSICPIRSYIEIFGWGDDSTNCKGNGERWLNTELADKEPAKMLDILYEDSRIVNAWYSFSIPKKRNLFQRIVNRVGGKLFERDEFVLKGKVYD